MKTRMIHIIALLCLSGAVLAGFGQGEAVNKIDAFSSASSRHSLKVDSILVYKTKALVFWSEYWEDDMDVLSYWLKWGQGDSTLPFNDSINIKPYEEKVKRIDTLQPLTENTEYHGLFYRDYNRKQFNVAFEFNTLPLSNTILAAAPAIKIAGRVAGYEIFTINGKQILSTNKSHQNSITASVVRICKNPGLYIINTIGVSGRVLQSEKILIGG